MSLDRFHEAPIFGRDGHKLGVLKSFIFDRSSGRIRYAVLSTDGFLGCGEDCRPLPFSMLDDNGDAPGFAVDLDADALAAAPHYRDGETPDRFFWSRLDAFFGTAAVHDPENPLLLVS